MTIEEFLTKAAPYLFALFVIACGGVGAFLKSWFDQRAKLTEYQTQLAALNVRMSTIEVDDTERTRKLSAEAQAIIQRTYSEQADRIRVLEDDTRHNRDLIDEARSENARLQGELNAEKELNVKLTTQQSLNIAQIGNLTGQVESLTAAGIERDKLKEEVNRLTTRVQEMEEKADTRHKEMSKITGEKFELDVNLRRATYDLQNAIRLLRECYEQAGKPTPALPEYPGNEAQSSAAPEQKESTE